MKEKISGTKKSAPIKVKQDMIDFIKNQGMTAALKRAGSISAKGGKGEAEFLEGVRRMYGANRLAAATKAATPKTDVSRASAKMPGRGPIVDMGMTAKKSASSTTRKPTSSSQPVKKSTTTDPLAKAVFGAGRAVGKVVTGSTSTPKGPKEAAYRAEQAKKVAAARKAEAARRASTKK